MKRREFSLSTAAGTLGAAFALGGTLVAPSHAQPAPAAAGGKPKAGSDYLVLDQRAPTEAPAGKTEVIEFFWYSCPHCSAFEPRFESWMKAAPADVAVRRVPVAFRDDFVPQQKLYYTLEALGKIDELHSKVFHAIHVERLPLAKDDQIVAWAVKQGLDKQKFLDTYNSFAVATKARRATQVQDAYKLAGVPALGVAGRYYIDGTLAGSMERSLQITDYLLAELRKGG